MAYTKVGPWANGGPPALSAPNLDHVETQYDEVIALPDATYGDGSDGGSTIVGDTTLTRDMYYNNLTVNPGVTLNPGGFRIFGKEVLTNNGTISGNGNDAVGVTAGAALAAGSLGASAAGGDGGTGHGGGGGGGARVVLIVFKHIVNTAGIISANGGKGANGVFGAGAGNGNNGGDISASIGGSGGNGGNGGGGEIGGIAGVATQTTPAQGGYRAPPAAIMLKDENTEFTGGAGGAGGGATNPTDAGGGGGGGGGCVVLIYNSLAAGSEIANGGAKGLKSGGAATDGVDGVAGRVIKIQNGG